MKLSTITKLSSITRTNYTVYKKGTWKGIAKGEFTRESLIEQFTVDYCGENMADVTAQILKRMKYEKAGAEVVNISINSASGKHGALEVAIEI